MPFLKFILLLLISSNISGGCHSNISVAEGYNVCSGKEFTITCQFDCQGYYVKLMKGEQLERRVESLNKSVKVTFRIPIANENNSGTYTCQTEPSGPIAMAHVTVKDCGFSPTYLPTVSTTSSSVTNTTHQRPTPSRILEPVLICYILFKAAFFFLGSIIAALTTVFQR